VSPTGVNLKVVGQRLELVAQALEDLRALPAATPENFRQDRRNAPAAESHLRRAIEALFDIARHLLAKGLGIGQLEYRAVARQALEKGFIEDHELAARFVQMAGFRNRLVHHYEEVTVGELYEVVRDHLTDLEALADELRRAAGRLVESSDA
jgi:uncharacterized protein YutE (UPF0331/DUF86 family)